MNLRLSIELNVELERRWGSDSAGTDGGEHRRGGRTEGAREGSLRCGDTVNVAARLEQSAKPGEILLGNETTLW